MKELCLWNRNGCADLARPTENVNFLILCLLGTREMSYDFFTGICGMWCDVFGMHGAGVTSHSVKMCIVFHSYTDPVLGTCRRGRGWYDYGTLENGYMLDESEYVKGYCIAQRQRFRVRTGILKDFQFNWRFLLHNRLLPKIIWVNFDSSNLHWSSQVVPTIIGHAFLPTFWGLLLFIVYLFSFSKASSFAYLKLSDFVDLKRMKLDVCTC